MEKLDPRAVWIFFFQSFLGGLVFTLVLGGFLEVWAKEAEIGINWWIITLFLIIILVLISYAWAKLYYETYKFELTEDTFKKEHGVIWKRYVSIPYERIQNVDIHRGVIARILGLSELMIQTAGYAGGYGRYGIGIEPEGKLSGLSKERAEEIREKLMRRVKGTKSGL